MEQALALIEQVSVRLVGRSLDDEDFSTAAAAQPTTDKFLRQTDNFDPANLSPLLSPSIYFNLVKCLLPQINPNGY